MYANPIQHKAQKQQEEICAFQEMFHFMVEFIVHICAFEKCHSLGLLSFFTLNLVYMKHLNLLYSFWLLLGQLLFLVIPAFLCYILF